MVNACRELEVGIATVATALTNLLDIKSQFNYIGIEIMITKMKANYQQPQVVLPALIGSHSLHEAGLEVL